MYRCHASSRLFSAAGGYFKKNFPASLPANLAVTLHCRTRRHAHNAARTEVLRRCRFAKLELGQVSMHQVTIQNRTLNLRVPRVLEEGHVGYLEAHRNLHGAQKLGGARR